MPGREDCALKDHAITGWLIWDSFLRGFVRVDGWVSHRGSGRITGRVVGWVRARWYYELDPDGRLPSWASWDCPPGMRHQESTVDRGERRR